MNATTLIHKSRRLLAEPVTVPMVACDGTVDACLEVTRMTSTAPLDEREVEIATSDERFIHQDESNQRVHEVSWLLERWDGEGKPLVWLRGRLVFQERDATNKQTWRLEDDWSHRLAQSVSTLTSEAAFHLNRPIAFELRVGTEENASTESVLFNHQAVHIPVPNTTQQPWTIGMALDWLSALGRLDLDRTALGASSENRLADEIDMNGRLGDVLESLCKSENLVIFRRFFEQDDPMPHERRLIVKATKAPIGDEPLDRHAPTLKKLGKTSASSRAQRYIAYGSRPRVEGSWIMVGGWLPDLENQSASEFNRLTSTNFNQNRDVFRKWVLNEHGGWSNPPFGRSIAVDLATLFQQPSLVPQPLSLLPCLTQNTSGQSKGVLLEVSFNSGQDWSAYSGKYDLLTDEAGVYLDDNTLDSSLLNAALNGTLRVRVTASVQSPEPFSQVRWTGNALHGYQPTRTWHAGQDYQWQFMDASSIHAADIEAGTLTADLRDDRHALRRRLDEFIASAREDESWSWVDTQLRPWLTAGQRVEVQSRYQATQCMQIQKIMMTVDVDQAHTSTHVELLPHERPTR